MSLGSAMMSPFDYREVMRAHFQYGETRTVDEVLAAHKARDKAASNSQPGGASKTPPAFGAPASLEQLAEARRLMNGGNPSEG